MNKIYAILAVAAVAACTAFAVSSFASRDPFFEANVEALMQTENEQCPDPYDVKGMALEFSQRTGSTTAEIDGELNVLGKTFKIGGITAGFSYTYTYEIAQCLREAPGNCCPNSRNGEIRNISVSI